MVIYEAGRLRTLELGGAKMIHENLTKLKMISVEFDKSHNQLKYKIVEIKESGTSIL